MDSEGSKWQLRIPREERQDLLRIIEIQPFDGRTLGKRTVGRDCQDVRIVRPAAERLPERRAVDLDLGIVLVREAFAQHEIYLGAIEPSQKLCETRLRSRIGFGAQKRPLALRGDKHLHCPRRPDPKAVFSRRIHSKALVSMLEYRDPKPSLSKQWQQPLDQRGLPAAARAYEPDRGYPAGVRWDHEVADASLYFGGEYAP